jgi:hypothetical protein
MPQHPEEKPIVLSCANCIAGGETCSFAVAEWKPKNGKSHGMLGKRDEIDPPDNGQGGRFDDAPMFDDGPMFDAPMSDAPMSDAPMFDDDPMYDLPPERTNRNADEAEGSVGSVTLKSPRGRLLPSLFEETERDIDETDEALDKEASRSPEEQPFAPSPKPSHKE